MKFIAPKLMFENIKKAAFDEKGETLEARFKDHALVGKWNGHRECHILPDLLLIYKIEENILILELVDTGSHADLFGK